jgi:hypothetical protein
VEYVLNPTEEKGEELKNKMIEKLNFLK